VKILTEDNIYKYIEPFILSLYLIFIFLSIQIWFLWKDIDKNESRIKSFFDDSFFTKNCMYVYSFSVYFIIHGFIDLASVPGDYLKTLEMLTLISLVLFTYDWYSMLEKCANKRTLPQEFAKWCLLFKRN